MSAAGFFALLALLMYGATHFRSQAYALLGAGAIALYMIATGFPS